MEAEAEPARGGSTSVLERPEVRRQKSDGDNERYSHYVSQERLKAAGPGRPVVALCGKVWVPMRNPQGYPVCPKCRAILDEMSSHGPGWPFFDAPGSPS
ncbi:DUF3039 domain-containing protein [Nanchangia anserum]|uniref:DUF3039 domain-containing protein n=2 Tax=Nanchangia anserum TaxID=2692125 RepID=A0A8I0KVH6_9ACTO|nr:DUF3039 domain-containing protein [Nanchangia anserum]QOX82616.1 DUF3039 domain-containing protein [Nanchangia anserum]